MKKILYDASIEHGILDVVDRLPGVCALRFGKTLSKIVLRNNILKAFAVAYLAKDYDIVAPDWYGYGRRALLAHGHPSPKENRIC